MRDLYPTALRALHACLRTYLLLQCQFVYIVRLSLLEWRYLTAISV